MKVENVSHVASYTYNKG